MVINNFYHFRAKKMTLLYRNCFKSDKVAEISYASRFLVSLIMKLSLTGISYPRQRLSCPKVPQQLCYARGTPLPTEGGQIILPHLIKA